MQCKSRHPSEKPIHRDGYKRLGFVRQPPDEPLTPGLRQKRTRTEAIGFLADYAWQQEPGDE